ncbi:MAG: peptidylprolyl isomerase [Chloroflexi bacterium]|nr:peptidylprolyl isomerase [Chloroflexota bacterium]
MTHSLARRAVRLAVATLVTPLLAACVGAPGLPTVPPATPTPTPDVTADTSGCPTSAPDPLPAGQTRTVTIATAKGSITIKVEADLGPLAAGNFVALAECGYYVGVVFHRLVPRFVIQGGDPTGTGGGGPGYEFPNDPVNVPYARGVVAMANAGVDTNGSQFFIVLADSGLDPNYSVFGRVTAGMDVVDVIAAMPNSGGQANAALEPVAMDSVTVTNP